MKKKENHVFYNGVKPLIKEGQLGGPDVYFTYHDCPKVKKGNLVICDAGCKAKGKKNKKNLCKKCDARLDVHGYDLGEVWDEIKAPKEDQPSPLAGFTEKELLQELKIRATA